jgi:Fur family ferric uptake transcriptional regulator
MAERNTIQKRAIQEVFQQADNPLSVAEVLRRAQQAVATLSQATVYRVLNSLLEKGIIDTVQLPGESPLYETAGKRHHHFFRCRRCETMYEVAGCSDLIDELVPRGFVLDDHEVFLFGTCAQCQRDA